MDLLRNTLMPDTLARKILTREAWLAEAESLYGKHPKHWQFKCPACGHVQSIESVIEHDKTMKPGRVSEWIYYNCEGRHNPRYGCDWTLGGIFTIHRLEVDGVRSFEFAGGEPDA